MLLAADDIVAPGGPSAPVWAFFTAISLALIAVIGQQISARRQAHDAKIEATKAAKNAKAAQENTASLSNGFASRVDRKLDAIITEQDSQGDALRKHLEWHLNRKEGP